MPTNLMSSANSGLVQRLERLPIHPFLFAVFPVLVAFTGNLDSLTWPQLIRPLAVSELLAVTLFLLGRALFLARRRAAIFSTSMLIVASSYGHIHHLIENWSLGGAHLGHHGWLLALFALFLASLVILLRSRQVPEGWPTSTLNIVGAAALIIQVSSAPFVQKDLEVVNPSAKLPDSLPAQPALDGLPDIYYIILDGYGRQDVLSLLYGFDNSDFINWLQSHGFYVASQSHPNYLITTLSLTASLNMQYIGELEDTYGVAFNEASVAQLIHHSTVQAWLEGVGYQTVAFDTGYGPTTIEDVDVYIGSRASKQGPLDILIQPRITRLEGILLDTSIFQAIQDYQVQHGNPGIFEATYSEHRERIRTEFALLDVIPEWPGPHFVFAHVIAPHPPFVFGPVGQPLTPSYLYTLADHHDDFVNYGTREEYVEGYVGQLKFVNHQIQKAIESILSKSGTQPIIIIQGDHGPGAYYTADSLSDTYLPERASNLNAYLVPASMKNDLYPTITPVNSFRLLFRDVFQTDIDLLADETYFNASDTRPVDPSVGAHPLP